ncbi:unnamed protein product [Prorocentrum cordatum]|uniref:histidine kinase n=1 Tax=Prorocentrum cordatum TaxID=2364126 RepID=A0ABN9VAB5_9DINO|nr:unnamed protein product [Polarella glacialis]
MEPKGCDHLKGYCKADVLGKSFVQTFISMEFRSDVDEVLTRALDGKDTANYTFPIFSKDGHQRQICLNATARRGQSGEVIGVIGVGQDITELSQTSAQHQRLAEDWQRLIETANAPILGVGTDGNVSEWNAKMAELTGSPKEDVIGLPFVREFIPSAHQDRVQSVLTKATREEETANFECPLCTKDGARIDLMLNATMRRDESGEVIGVFGVGQDITNLREALTENSRIADDLMRLIDTANAPIFGVDTDGCVTEWNQKAAEISGFCKEESLGKRFVETFISNQCMSDVDAVFKLAFIGTNTANYTFTLFTKDGRRREICLNATARRGPAGDITGVISVGQDITDFNLISAQNERLAADWQRLIETANAPIFGVDISGNVIEWNRKAAEISGYSKETETIGRHLVREFITPEHRDRVQAVLEEAMSGRETANFEFPLATKDGRRIDILLNATTKRDQNGRVYGVLGVGQDITEFRKALTENSRIADDLMRLIDTANAPILGIDTEGCVTEWNQKAAELSGYGKAETLGKNFIEGYISDNFRDDIKGVLARALAGTDTANYTFPLFTKDGRRREISLNATARRGPNDEIIGVIGVGQDITDLNQIMAQNERFAADWQRLIQTANAPIFGVDINGLVNEWNSKSADISGYSKQESMGHHLVQEFITPEHRERVQAVLAEALKGDETASFEFPLATKDGKRIDILLNATTRRDEHGAVVGVLGVGQDITNMKAALTDNARIADDLTRLIDTANAPILGIDTDGRVTEWNQKAADLSGYSRAEAIGKAFVEVFISEKFRAEVSQVLTMALAGTDTANYAFPLFTRDGRRREISLNATARRGPHGEITGVIGVGQDFTELNAIMAQNERLAADWQRLIHTANAPIFGVDVTGHVNEWNVKIARGPTDLWLLEGRHHGQAFGARLHHSGASGASPDPLDPGTGRRRDSKLRVPSGNKGREAYRHPVECYHEAR